MVSEVELTNVPGLAEGQRVIIKKLGYGSKNMLASKSTNSRLNNAQIDTQVDVGIYNNWLLVLGIKEAPFFPAGLTMEQKYRIVENDTLSTETGMFLAKHIAELNNFAEIEELKKNSQQ